jgi:hypothetical protein
MEFTKTEQVFYNKYIGNFATPKKLNRSSKKITDNILTEIEEGNITSVTIKNIALSFPVFVYKTCLTIHGNLPEIIRKRIGGYKNLIQNKNGSLEVRYSAIDYEQKKLISTYLSGTDWRSTENSQTGIYFSKTTRTADKTEAINILDNLRLEAEDFSIAGLKAKVNVTGYNYFGMYYLTMYVMPLLIEADPLHIAAKLTNLEPEHILAKYNQEQAENIERHNKAEQLKNDRERAKLEAKNILESKYPPQQIKPNLGSIYAAPTVLNTGILGYRFYKVDKLGNFGRLLLETYCSSSIEVDSTKFQPYMKGKQIAKAELPQNTYLIV